MRVVIVLLIVSTAAAQPIQFPNVKPIKIPPVAIGNLGMPAGARKINGRWWTKDNRELIQQMGMWQPMPAAPGMAFHHHEPFDIRLAEYTHLGMSKEQIQAAIGPPNRTVAMANGITVWTYFSANGASTNVGFQNGLVADVLIQDKPGQAKMRRPATITAELASRPSTQLALQDALNRQHGVSTPRAETKRRARTPSAAVIPAEPVAAAPKRVISDGQAASIAAGMSRQEVIDKLGEPSGTFSIAGMENAPETLTYHLESGKTVEIKIEAGKVAAVRR